MKSFSLLISAAMAVLLTLASPALAQSNYPTRPITFIVPFAPGGPADVLGRLIGQKMSEDLGQQVVIDNRSGANTIVGAIAAAPLSALFSKGLHAPSPWWTVAIGALAGLTYWAFAGRKAGASRSG